MNAILLTLCSLLMQDGNAAEAAGTAGEEAAAAVTAPEVDATANGLDVFTKFGPVFEKTEPWAWFVLLGLILAGLIVGKVAQMGLRSAAERLRARGWELRSLIFRDVASPASLVIFTLGLQAGLIWIHTVEIHDFVSRILNFLYILAIGWFVFNLVDLVDLGLRRVTESRGKLAMQLVPLIRKALRIFIVVVFGLFIAQNIFEQNITAWLAGLGIAGLAVSLAAQDSIKNLFGSITVLLDKPFAVGDRITFNGADGFVEEIGFRSTKVRTFAGHLITIPNMKFIDGQVENISARPFIRRTLNVTITYDTPPEKIEQAMEILKGLLAEPEFTTPFNLEERPPRIFFSDYNADSLNIAVTYWYFLDEAKGQDWWGYMAHAEQFNLRLFRSFGEAGIDFAFPTQTLYLAGDPNRELAVRIQSGSAPPAS